MTLKPVFVSIITLNMLKKLFYLFILAVVFFGCSVKVQGKSDKAQNSSSGDSERESLQKIETFSLEGYSEGTKKKWEIEGKSADILEETVRLDDVKAKSYGKEGEVNLKGEEGEYDKKENTITIEKNVVVTTSEGASLKTEKLVWDAGKQTASTDKDVSVEKDNIYCEGKGAFANPQEKKIRIDKEVRVEIKPKTMITCKGPMELNYENNIAVFYNDVEVEDERGNILADKIEVYFLSGTRQIEKIISYGNVRLSQGENTAYSEEAVYDSPSGKIILKGNPKLVIYPKD